MTEDTLEYRSAGRPRLAPPVVTRQRSVSEGSRTADVFAPPFAGGRTLDRPGDPAAATAAEPEPVDIMVDDWEPAIDESADDAAWLQFGSTSTPEIEGGGVPAEDEAYDEAEAEDEREGAAAEFPTDAFIVPEDTLSVPGGWTSEPAADLGTLIADRLERLASSIRTGGLTALAAPDADELSRSIAFIVAGFYRRGE